MTVRWPRRIAVTLTIGLTSAAAAPHAGAQQPKPLPTIPAQPNLPSEQAHRPLPPENRCLLAVKSHTPGSVDASVQGLAQWRLDELPKIVRLGLNLGRSAEVDWRALMLHTDAALADRAAFEAGRRTASDPGVQLVDAMSVGALPRSPQWAIARQIAATLAQRSGGAPFARRWYRATGAMLQQWAECGALRAHLEAGLKVFPDDPVLLMQRGTLHQTFADPRVQTYLRQVAVDGGPIVVSGSLSMDAPLRTSNTIFRGALRVGDLSAELGAAERDLRQAVAADATLVEARIRLGHVLGMKGQHDEAIALEQAALGAPLPPFLEYYAAIVLGRSAQALDRRDEARRAFERAVAVFPTAQSARIGVSQGAIADQRPADGIAAIVAVSGPDAARDEADPWWWYYRVHEPQAKALIDTMRTEVPR